MGGKIHERDLPPSRAPAFSRLRRQILRTGSLSATSPRCAISASSNDVKTFVTGANLEHGVAVSGRLSPAARLPWETTRPSLRFDHAYHDSDRLLLHNPRAR